jgi:hypothetical protein
MTETLLLVLMLDTPGVRVLFQRKVRTLVQSCAIMPAQMRAAQAHSAINLAHFARRTEGKRVLAHPKKPGVGVQVENLGLLQFELTRALSDPSRRRGELISFAQRSALTR